MLGNYLGSTHTSPDLTMDINKIISSLDSHDVYRLRLGRTFQDEDEPIQDAESTGLYNLMDGNASALREYNESFKSSQETHRQPIVSKMASHTTLPKRPSEAAATTTPVPINPSEVQEIPDSGISGVDQDSDGSEEEELGQVDESDEDSEAQGLADDDQLLEDELGTMFNDEVDSLVGESDGEWLVGLFGSGTHRAWL